VGVGHHHWLVAQPPGLVLGALTHRVGLGQLNFNLERLTLVPTSPRQPLGAQEHLVAAMLELPRFSRG
jgi:hypothetical protein